MAFVWSIGILFYAFLDVLCTGNSKNSPRGPRIVKPQQLLSFLVDGNNLVSGLQCTTSYKVKQICLPVSRHIQIINPYPKSRTLHILSISPGRQLACQDRNQLTNIANEILQGLRCRTEIHIKIKPCYRSR